jgi:ABC-type branched-subunit amino acid transport system substrate-binding protein
VKDAGKYMVSFGLYHPAMNVPPIGKEVAAEYTKRTKGEPNRLIFQAADSLLLIAEAIKQAKSTDPKAITKALQSIKFSGVRGPLRFRQGAGHRLPAVGGHPVRDLPAHGREPAGVEVEPGSGAGQKLAVNKLQRAK